MLMRFLRNCFAKNRVATIIAVVVLVIALVFWAVKAVIGWLFVLCLVVLVWVFGIAPLLTKMGVLKKAGKPGAPQ